MLHELEPATAERRSRVAAALEDVREVGGRARPAVDAEPFDGAVAEVVASKGRLTPSPAPASGMARCRLGHPRPRESRRVEQGAPPN